jgi:hypothetical protein
MSAEADRPLSPVSPAESQFYELSRRYLRAVEKLSDSPPGESAGGLTLDRASTLLFKYQPHVKRLPWKILQTSWLNLLAFIQPIGINAAIGGFMTAYLSMLMAASSHGDPSGILLVIACFLTAPVALFMLMVASLDGSSQKNLPAMMQPDELSVGSQGISLRWRGRVLSFASFCLEWKQFELVYEEEEQDLGAVICLKNRKGQILRLAREGFAGEKQFEAFRLLVGERLESRDESSSSALKAQPLQKPHLLYLFEWLKHWGKESPGEVESGTLQEGRRLKGGAYTIHSFAGNDGYANVYLASCSRRTTGAGDGLPDSSPDDLDSEIVLAGSASRQALVRIREICLPAQDEGFSKQDWRRRLKALQKIWNILSKLENCNRGRTRLNRSTTYWLDHFVEDGRFFVVEELVREQSLRQFVEERGKLSEPTAIDLSLQMLDILMPPVILSASEMVTGATKWNSLVHVHGQLSPASFSISRHNRIRLTDFDPLANLPLTGHATFSADLAFLPPEHIHRGATAGDDVYSIGAILFFMLTGKRPPPGEELAGALAQLKISDGIKKVIARATDPRRWERYVHVEEIWFDLKKLCGDPD